MVSLKIEKRDWIHLGIALFVLAFGLFLFNNSRDFVRNFKTAYVWELYLPLVTYQSKTGIASAWDLVTPESEASEIGGGGRSAFATNVPVLTYHRVMTEADGFNLELNQFMDQMFALKEAGYETVTLQELYDHFTGKRQLPAKAVLLTFDDGRTESYYPVDPILAALDYNAVMFVITERSLPLSGERSQVYLSDGELKKMVKSGRWEIQSHSKNGHGFINLDVVGNQGHFFSHKMWLPEEKRLETTNEYADRVRSDLIGAKERIQEILGNEVIGFSYPFGDYGSGSLNFPESHTTLSSIVEEIYPISFHQGFNHEPYLQYSDSAPGAYFVRRLEVTPEVTTVDLLDMVRTAAQAYVSPPVEPVDETPQPEGLPPSTVTTSSLVKPTPASPDSEYILPSRLSVPQIFAMYDAGKLTLEEARALLLQKRRSR